MINDYLKAFAAATALPCLLMSTSLATLPYVPAGGPYPVLGPGVAPPTVVGGKEYSHDFDQTTALGGGLPDPEQVIAWDGAGGTLDGVDFSGSRPNSPQDQQVDALANSNDFLFNQLLDDTAHLIFTHDDVVYSPGGGFSSIVPTSGPVLLSNGNVIGGSGEISIEQSGFYTGAPPAVQGLWASAAEVNGSPLPRDVDGLEVWGPEPGVSGDSDKYSLEIDIIAGAPPTGGPAISVFSYDSFSGVSTPYIDHATIFSAVTSLLGPMPGGVVGQHDQPGIEGLNLDALMVRDIEGSDLEFNPSDQIIFSISQLVDRATGSYYATGSELFVLDGTGTVSFLQHGGHVWDPAYALSVLSIGGVTGGQGVIDINGIEAISQSSVPEPSTLLLSLLGIGCVALRRWK